MADDEQLPNAAPVLELLNGFRKSKVRQEHSVKWYSQYDCGGC
jgi:hypothetical protein